MFIEKGSNIRSEENTNQLNEIQAAFSKQLNINDIDSDYMVNKIIDHAEDKDFVYLTTNRSESESLINNFRSEGIMNDILVYCSSVEN